MAINQGDKVKIDYTGTLDDGIVFDTSEGKGPLEIEAGSGKVIKGFDDAILGMGKGEEKTVKIEAKDAYGDYNPDLKQKIPREQLPKYQEPKPRMVLVVKAPNGHQYPVKS